MNSMRWFPLHITLVGDIKNVSGFINRGQISDAMDEMKCANTSKRNVMKRLINRRNFEVNLFLNDDDGAN